MPRGGTRSGTPGKRYSNRTDLNRPAPHQTYGKGAAQQAAMKAVPIQPTPPIPTQPSGEGGAAPDLMGLAESWQPLPGAPHETTRPQEPTTAGLSVGRRSGVYFTVFVCTEVK